jgi:hypothetical protein
MEDCKFTITKYNFLKKEEKKKLLSDIYLNDDELKRIRYPDDSERLLDEAMFVEWPKNVEESIKIIDDLENDEIYIAYLRKNDNLIYHGDVGKEEWWKENPLPQGQSFPFAAWFSTKLNQAEISGKGHIGVIIAYKIKKDIPLVYVKQRRAVFDIEEENVTNRNLQLGEMIINYFGCIGFQGYFSENECEICLINERVNNYIEFVGIAQDNRTSRSYRVSEKTKTNNIKLSKKITLKPIKCMKCKSRNIIGFDKNVKKYFCSVSCQSFYYY